MSTQGLFGGLERMQRLYACECNDDTVLHVVVLPEYAGAKPHNVLTNPTPANVRHGGLLPSTHVAACRAGQRRQRGRGLR